MKRREFIRDLGGVAALALTETAHAQAKVRLIGVALGSVRSDPESQERIAAFRQGLQDRGWREGVNVRFEYRWMGNSLELARTYAAELWRWHQQLKEMSPTITRIAMLGDPNNHNFAGFSGAFVEAARRHDVLPVAAPVRDASEIEAAMSSVGATSNGGVIVTAAIFSLVHRKLIFDLANAKRLPVIYWSRFFAVTGGLMSYGPNTDELHRQSAAYVDLILKGARPADLPVQEATKYESVINMTTARSIGLVPSQQLLLRADEVIG
jgi:hypothetical protein